MAGWIPVITPLTRIVFLCVVLTLFAPSGASHAAMEDFPVVRLQSLDKITARTMVFEARVGSTVKFGPLYIRTRACRKSPPIEKPEAAAFLQIWQVSPKEEPEWVFSGWMFASSPALSAMDHPVYDVWVLDCLERKSSEQPPPETGKDAAAGGSAPPAGNEDSKEEPDPEAQED